MLIRAALLALMVISSICNPKSEAQSDQVSHYKEQLTTDGRTVAISRMPEKDFWDKAALFFNGGLFLVGLVGVGLAVATYRSTIISSERQLRAYLFPVTFDLHDGTTLNVPRADKTNVPGIEIIFKNTGRTPAYRVVNWADMAVIYRTEESRKLTVPTLEPIAEMTMGTNQSFNRAIWFDRTLSSEEIAEIVSGIRAIYVYGRVEYWDVFGRKHFTNYRLHYSSSVYPPIKPGGGMIYSEGGNEAN